MAKEFNVHIQGRAFFLRPDMPKEGKPRDPRPGEEDGLLAEPLRSYATEAGLVMRRPPLTPNTTYALEATEYAQEQGQFDAFHHATYKALWEDGKNLGDLDVLREIAEGCGLNGRELSERLESGYYRAAVQEQHQQAMDMEVHAIPSFVVGNLLFSGAQPYEVFSMAVRRVQAERSREV